MKNYLDIDVHEASKKRIKTVFDEFDKIYLSFSGGKDSTVMLHLVMEEAILRNRKIGILIVDLEAQYKLTMDHIEKCIDMYKENIELFWVCLPIKLRNAVSVYEPTWTCWQTGVRWVREIPKQGISDHSFFPFFRENMEFEEFVPEFGEWYASGEKCACLVGIRADESLNRFRTIASKTKTKYKNHIWTTLVTENVFNMYPIYDWKTEDIWIFTKKFNKPMNDVYERMRMAGVSLSQMRICQPYGDDQRRGLWLYHLIEPETWWKIVERVSGANSGSLYIQESGNINGYGKINKPENHTYKSYSELLLVSMPDKTRAHYAERFNTFINWWKKRGYPGGIPDEAPYELESERIVPSYRRICKVLLRNDWWCKGLSFTQPSSESYKKFKEFKKNNRLKQ